MMAALALVLALLVPSAGLAQQQTLFGPDGRVAGHVVTDSSGATTVYRSRVR